MVHGSQPPRWPPKTHTSCCGVVPTHSAPVLVLHDQYNTAEVDSVWLLRPGHKKHRSVCLALSIYLFLFIYLFLAALGLCCCVQASSSCGATPQLWCAGFSLPWFVLLQSTGSRQWVSVIGLRGSVVEVHGLQSARLVHGLSCPLACRILVPRSRIKPLSAALAGRFLTPGPPGKSLPCSFGLFTLEGASCYAVRMVASWREEARSPDNSQHQFASQPRKDKHHRMFVLSCSVMSDSLQP